MAAPITLLRQCTMADIPPRLVRADGSPAKDLSEADRVLFPTTTTPSSTTSVSSFAVTDAAGYKDYSLLTLLFFAEHRKLDQSNYLQKSLAFWAEAGAARGRDVPSVSIIDRRDLIEYLTGVSETSQWVVGSAPGTALVAADKGAAEERSLGDSASKEGKRSAEDDQESLELKRARQAVAEDWILIKAVIDRERSIVNMKNFLSSKSTKSFSLALKYGGEVLRPPKIVAPQVSSASKTTSRPSGSSNQAPSSSSKPAPSQSSSSKSRSSSSHHSSKLSSSSSKSKSSASAIKMPIIVVPAALQAMITLHNVKGFLVDSKYEPTEEFVKRGDSKPPKVIIDRKVVVPGCPKSFEIIDSVDRLASEDWERIVAVFATGQEWQFKNWRFGTVVNILAKVKGFCVTFNDEPLNDKLKNWNVTSLTIHRSRRHLDAQEVSRFWSVVDSFIRESKGELFSATVPKRK